MATTKQYSKSRSAKRKRENTNHAPDAVAPPELRIWERISEQRKALVEEIDRLERGDHPLVQWLRDRGAEPQEIAPVVRTRVREVEVARSILDARVRGLRGGKGGTYALSKLALVAEDHYRRMLKEVRDAVRKWLRGEADARAVQTVLALLRRSDFALDLPAVRDVSSANHDLDGLDVEARAWCNRDTRTGGRSRYGSTTQRAYYIVARVTGWHPDGRGARNDQGLSPDQVKHRISDK